MVQDSPPATTDLEEGTLWWNSDADDLRLYVLYNDPAPDAGLKWVQATPTTGSSGGVTSIIAGDGISVNQATGDVTVSATDDGSGYVKLDDGGVKQVIKSAGLGLSDGTDENITLGADGSITAASTVQSLGSAGGYNAFSAGYGNSTTDAFVVRGNGTIVDNDAGAATTGNYKYKLDSNGSAIFTSEVTSGSAYNIGDGTVLYPQGLLGIRKDGLEAGVIQVLNGGSTTDEETVSIANTGSAGFGLNANWAGAFFGIRKGTNNWAQHISIDSTSTAPSGFLVSVGVDNPTGGTALLCQKRSARSWR